MKGWGEEEVGKEEGERKEEGRGRRGRRGRGEGQLQHRGGSLRLPSDFVPFWAP